MYESISMKGMGKNGQGCIDKGISDSPLFGLVEPGTYPSQVLRKVVSIYL